MCFKKVSRMFQEVSTVSEESLKGVSWKFHRRGRFKDFQGYFQSVSREFQENFQGVSKRFHVARHSSQIPEQKEGLFFMKM